MSRRIEAIWSDCRARWGAAGEGPFLFGRWSIADAAYAPVATRFRTYGVTLAEPAAAYMAAVLADPDFLRLGRAGEEGPAAGTAAARDRQRCRPRLS